jgi:uncharacterized repeat protein (TIGR01451 family)
MRQQCFRVAVQAVAVLFLFAGTGGAARLEPRGDSVDSEVLIRMKGGASANDVAALERLADADKVDKLTTIGNGALMRIRSRSKNVDALVKALSHNPNIEYVEPNYVLRLVATPNDTRYAELWGLRNTGQTILGSPGFPGSDTNAEAAWNVTTGSASIVVGVVDTGIDYTHPDLAANIWSNPGGVGNCAAGTHGFNAITRTCDPKDDHYHGTHVAGTIGAAGNNNAGIAGVNWTTSIMGLKFLGATGFGTTADAIVAIDFAVQAKIAGVNIRVLNNSWGGGAFSRALLDVINKANEHDILFVAAAGNDSLNLDTFPVYPASYATPNMVAVAAIDNRDGIASFSNYGATSVHLGAPGVSVLSTIPGNAYAYLNGTSMASPHVAGVAALVLASAPGLTTAQLKSAILNNTDPISQLAGRTVTGGRLNAARAIGAPLGPEFTLSVSPVARSISRGSLTTYTVTVNPANGFTDPVTLSVTGLPPGVTGTFTPPSTTTTSTLTLTTTQATPLTTANFTIAGNGGSLTRFVSAALTITAAPVGGSCPSFPLRNFYGSTSPTAIAIGDLNRDGVPDMVVAMVSSNRIAVHMGTFAGQFQAGNSYVVGSAPVSVAIGDVNGDGKPDVATANSNAHTVSVLAGGGDGTLQPAAHYAVGTNPFAVAAGDFNADGKLDLAAANNGSANVSILLNAGDGTFGAPAHYAAASGPFALAAGDLNADGALDLAVAAFNVAKVSVLHGTGNGAFGAPVQNTAGEGTSGVAIADFNGDGRPDLAASNFLANTVSVFLANPDATFQAASTHPVGTSPYAVAAADFNNDAKPDLITANNLSATASIVMNTGAGFLPAAHITAAQSPNHVATGDFDLDGKSDFAVANTDSQSISIHLNAGICAINCNTMAAAAAFAAGTDPKAVAAGDLDRDARVDLVTANQGADSVSILLGNGDGTLDPPANVDAGNDPQAIAIGDFDRDGKLDLVTANNASNDVSVLLGNGDGTVEAAVAYGAAMGPRAVTIGDFNRDGRGDLAVTNGGSANVSILLGNANGTFQTATHHDTGASPRGIATGDVNRDGKLDLAVASSGSNDVSLLLGNGNGTFQTAASIATGTAPYAVVIADFNRDGKLDLATANSGSNDVTLRLGNGDGSFGIPSAYAAGTAPHALTAADFDHDGRLDLAVANNGANSVSILIANLAGGFASATTHPTTGMSPAAIIAADLNRDGKPELAAANSGTADVAIFVNTCPVPDLTITKTHSGTFTQGDTNRTYTITVTNAGTSATTDAVSVTDALPPGLTLVSMAGTGWTCAGASCTRGDVLAGGASYPPITLTVNVAGSAAANLTNVATVSGGGEINTVNSTAADPTAIAPSRDLVVAVSHAGNFAQGNTGRTYTIAGRNAGGLATSGEVAITATVPSGLTATALGGTGWTCVLGSLACTRTDALAGSSSFPPITLTVNVAANAPALVTLVAAISNAGDANPANNTASDPTVVWSGQSCASFAFPANLNTSAFPNAVVARDFNGDGKPDLAVANSQAANVSVHLGNGNGTFATGVAYGTGAWPYSVEAGDLNNDGHPDLVTSNTAGNSVSVLLGNGNGTFNAAVHYPVSSGGNVTLGDFNADGNLDVATTMLYSGSIAILLGNGNGGLQAPAAHAIGTTVWGIAQGDFNGDGRIDLALSREVGGVAVVLGNGNGTFGAPVLHSGLSYSYSVAVSDLNGDGNADLVVPNYYHGSVSLWLGTGQGTFTAGAVLPVVFEASDVIAEDINGDGAPDIIVSGWSAAGVAVLLGNGDGSFQTMAAYNTGSVADDLAVGDFNADGRADLAVTSTYASSVAILLGGCPELRLTKTHEGNFSAGQVSATYRLAVQNTGTSSSRGPVTVTDTLPAGLTAVSVGGFGWSCTLAPVQCVRTEPIANGTTSPEITLTVGVANNAPANVTNIAAVSGGGDVDLTNNTASDPTMIVTSPNLTITKTHAGGSFAQGEAGRTFTLTVSNIGAGPTTGPVQVADAIPTGLVATAISGVGWTCNVNGPSCSRSDALQPGESYNAITVTVMVGASASSPVTNIATVSGGGDVTPQNNTAADVVPVLATPQNFSATGISSSQVSLTWNAIAGATGYQVLRRNGDGTFSVIAAPITNSYLDTSLTATTTYVYQVRAIDAASFGPLSAREVATTVLFSDDPILTRATSPKPAHILELRAAVNAVRIAAGLPAATFADPALTAGMPMRASHVTELRTRLNEARTALGIPVIAFTDPVIGAGAMVVKAVHIRELRTGVK